MSLLLLTAGWAACGGDDDDDSADADADADSDADADADSDFDATEACRLACEHDAGCVPGLDADACLAGCLCYGVELVEPEDAAAYLECSATVECAEESSSYCAAQVAAGGEPSSAALGAAGSCAEREAELCPAAPGRLACDAVLIKTPAAVAAFEDCLGQPTCDEVLACRFQSWRDLCQ
ncbi:MAG: hypothetical protein HYY06_30125 [Deltaproteobacteria bacterium]|nr:hypothetical protein [Deltaproteobacteria bacterium]